MVLGNHGQFAIHQWSFLALRRGLLIRVIIVVIIMFIMLVFAWIMVTLVHVFFVRDTFEMDLELALALALRQRAHLHVDVTASHLGLLVGMTHGDQVSLDLSSQGMAEFLVGHLTATELQLDAYLVAFRQEIFRVDDLDQVVMRVNADTEFQLLQLATFLVLVGFLLMLFLDVLVLAVIHDFAYRRLSAGGDFDKVESALFGHAQGLLGGQHAILLIGDAIDNADFWRTDTLIDAGLVGITAVVTLMRATAAGTVEWRATATGWTGLVSSWGWTRGRGAGAASSRCSRRRLGRSWIVVWASAELAGAQVIEWIANG